MKMERINENTIRVLIGNEDLSERGITVLDLLGNHKQIESFFYSILEEVDTDHQFQQNDAVTFQVLPNRNGLELFISKGDVGNDDDSDTFTEDTTEEEVPDFLRQELMATDNAANDEQTDESHNKDGYTINKQTSEKVEAPVHDVVIKLHDFDGLIAISQLMHLTDAKTSLYKYQGDYYLEFVFDLNIASKESIKDELAVAYEYADQTPVTIDLLEEHGTRLMENAAFELTRRYFVK
ncbi:anti-adapter protein IraD [Secundilactobacillus oryzae JCM 18671]|uniref:Adapter protein MecA n=1 Tax=Secundilactobacillus oryzae JCM 18671 TaxID=1291743 RepID=A0A081BGK0_9LACO|nr:adaptor protein MecA [Secundilactobacillus oryzae]GAK47168.1 anti-adapter protein IraD [Secundilactobacillus oryzae JCM 18671]